MGKGAGGMKRTVDEKAARNRASRDFYANEIAWGITIAYNLGLDAAGAMKYISEDYDRWADFVRALDEWPAPVGGEDE